MHISETVLWITLYILLALAAWTLPVHAQIVCDTHETIDSGLRDNYGETVPTRALSGSGLLFFTYANRETGSWTLVRVKPDGPACIMAAGVGFWLMDEPMGEAL